MGWILSVIAGLVTSLQSSGKRYSFEIAFDIVYILQLSLPDYVTKRVRHSLSAIQLSPERVLLVVFGGRRQSVFRDKLSHTALVELSEQ